MRERQQRGDTDSLDNLLEGKGVGSELSYVLVCAFDLNRCCWCVCVSLFPFFLSFVCVFVVVCFLFFVFSFELVRGVLD